jgi:predicted phage terminase large subunit-like protein
VAKVNPKEKANKSQNLGEASMLDWNNLSEEDLEFILLNKILLNPYIPVTPTLKQWEFLSRFDPEVMYGGAAGGGKSAGILMAALMFVTEPNYNALILRRNYSQLALPGALIDLSKEWLAETDARWNDNDKKWTFPSGSTLTFGYLDCENDKYRYQGAAFHFVGFDELTQFTETNYKYLFSRNRKSISSAFPLRFRAGSNPGGIGHEWVKSRFVTSPLAYQKFVSAKLEDNPHLDKESYEKNLEELDPVTRRQLREGDWNVSAAGNFFPKHKFIPVELAPLKGRKVRYWDFAGSKQKEGQDPDWTVGCLMQEYAGQYWILDIVRDRCNPQMLEHLVSQTAECDGRSVPIFIEQEPGSSGLIATDHYIRNVLKGYSVKAIKTTGSKVNRAKPLSAAVENDNVHILKARWNESFLDECSVFPQEGFHDDQPDAASGAFTQLATSGKIIIESVHVDRSSRTLKGY